MKILTELIDELNNRAEEIDNTKIEELIYLIADIFQRGEERFIKESEWMNATCGGCGYVIDAITLKKLDAQGACRIHGCYIGPDTPACPDYVSKKAD